MRQRVGSWQSLLMALLPALAGGCVTGEGDGWVTGGLQIANCDNGDPLEQPDDFDLRVDFFAGEPIQDGKAPKELRRNSLNIRLQHTSNNFEEADGLVLVLNDLSAVARLVVQKLPIPATNTGLCDQGCIEAQNLLRARLYLYARCPDNREPLVGLNSEVDLVAAPLPGQEPCPMASQPELQSCPVLTADQVATLDGICGGDFEDRSHAATIAEILGGGACLYLCQLGTAAEQDPADLAGFTIHYGDRVAGLFSLNLVDARSIASGTCALAGGNVNGMFTFIVQRGRAAQTFP